MEEFIMLKVKELKEILQECNDDDYVSLEYLGCDIELERGDTFRDIDLQDIELNHNNVNIAFS